MYIIDHIRNWSLDRNTYCLQLKVMYMLKLKAFMRGFDYAIKNFDKIEDHHFHTFPGANWHDRNTNNIYRKGILYGRKYINYRLETLTLIVLIFTSLLFMFTW